MGKRRNKLITYVIINVTGHRGHHLHPHPTRDSRMVVTLPANVRPPLPMRAPTHARPPSGPRWPGDGVAVRRTQTPNTIARLLNPRVEPLSRTPPPPPPEPNNQKKNPPPQPPWDSLHATQPQVPVCDDVR